MNKLLELKNFELSFKRYNYFNLNREPLKIISGFDIHVKKKDFFTIIGSSGSGKSLMAHAVLGILPSNAETKGEIVYKGQALTQKKLRKLRGKEIVLVPQSVSFLNPLKTSGWHIQHTAQRVGMTKKEADFETDKVLELFSLDSSIKKLYPFELSGGMARRILAAIAFVTQAELFIADEPTTGLDAVLVEESLKLLHLMTQQGKTVVLITHDLKAALKVSHQIAIFYGGTIIEVTEPYCFSDESHLRHPYSRALFRALPENGFHPLIGINPFGEIISQGCVFVPRCSDKKPECRIKKPIPKNYDYGHVRCFNA